MKLNFVDVSVDVNPTAPYGWSTLGMGERTGTGQEETITVQERVFSPDKEPETLDTAYSGSHGSPCQEE